MPDDSDAGSKPIQLSPAEQYDQITKEYNSRMKAALDAKQPREMLHEIGDWRRNKLRKMVRNAGSLGDCSATAGDFAACALAYELLQMPEECVRFSRFAIAVDPKEEAAYKPLIRALLNLDRVDEAEAAVLLAESHVCDPDKWRGMRYFLFVKCKHEQMWNRAASHLTVYVDSLAYSMSEGAEPVKKLNRTLLQIIDIYKRSSNYERSREEQIDMLMKQCSSTLQELNSRMQTPTADELAHFEAVCELQCNLAQLTPTASLDECVKRWADELVESKWRESPKPSLERAKRNFLAYLRSNEMRIHDANSIISRFSKQNDSQVD